ncbi:DUF6193 family natural product biosynthesis protein [Embleya sp. MST-111070]|uniref:DUF6193 family natural product biosynthesis protein n=1 Tax=Embleya sp. MST-111070 TaxID=3398231 RepID=UPI003F738E1D
MITPIDGKYRVTEPRTRSPHNGRADIGEADNPQDAVALVVAHLPPEYGPAVVGTAHDFDGSDAM